MKKTRDGKRRFNREFKIAAVRRVSEGETAGAVARDLRIRLQLLWKWRKRVAEKGEDQLHEIGRPKGRHSRVSVELNQKRRIAELESLIGRQQMEIRFLDKALRRVEEQRPQKNDGGATASSKK